MGFCLNDIDIVCKGLSLRFLSSSALRDGEKVVLHWKLVKFHVAVVNR